MRLIQMLLLTGAVLLLTCLSGLNCRDNHWDYMLFTQQWPPAVCMEAQGEHKCQIPQNVTSWSVHGVWPSQWGTELPQYCNNTWKFNAQQIAPIEGQLMEYWPNLYTDSKLTEFWEHEWTKHGTCAASLPDLNSEFKYFNTGLKLNRQFNIASALKEADIVPSNTKNYTLGDFQKAFANAYGLNMEIHCLKSKKESWQTIVQIGICLDKTFAQIDCKTHTHDTRLRFEASNEIANYFSMQSEPCLSNYNISYPVIKH